MPQDCAAMVCCAKDRPAVNHYRFSKRYSWIAHLGRVMHALQQDAQTCILFSCDAAMQPQHVRRDTETQSSSCCTTGFVLQSITSTCGGRIMDIQQEQMSHQWQQSGGRSAA